MGEATFWECRFCQQINPRSLYNCRLCLSPKPESTDEIERHQDISSEGESSEGDNVQVATVGSEIEAAEEADQAKPIPSIEGDANTTQHKDAQHQDEATAAPTTATTTPLPLNDKEGTPSHEDTTPTAPATQEGETTKEGHGHEHVHEQQGSEASHEEQDGEHKEKDAWKSESPCRLFHSTGKCGYVGHSLFSFLFSCVFFFSFLDYPLIVHTTFCHSFGHLCLFSHAEPTAGEVNTPPTNVEEAEVLAVVEELAAAAQQQQPTPKAD